MSLYLSHSHSLCLNGFLVGVIKDRLPFGENMSNSFVINCGWDCRTGQFKQNLLLNMELTVIWLKSCDCENVEGFCLERTLLGDCSCVGPPVHHFTNTPPHTKQLNHMKMVVQETGKVGQKNPMKPITYPEKQSWTVSERLSTECALETLFICPKTTWGLKPLWKENTALHCTAHNHMSHTCWFRTSWTWEWTQIMSWWLDGWPDTGYCLHY